MRTKRKTIHFIGAALAVAIGVPLARGWFLSLERDSGESAYNVSCASHLRQLGQATQLYADAHGGAVPDSFDVALRFIPDLPPSTLDCPSARQRHDDSLAALVGLAAPMPPSYVYLGDGLTTRMLTAEAILAVERDDNHPGGGMNVLFGDGHVESLTARRRERDEPWWAAVKSQIARGVRPVMMPTLTR